MGILSYYRTLLKTHPSIVINDTTSIQIDHLYLDFNGFIHGSLQNLKKNNKIDKIFDSSDDESVHSESSNKSSNDENKHVEDDSVIKPKPIIKKVIRRPPPIKENE